MKDNLLLTGTIGIADIPFITNYDEVNTNRIEGFRISKTSPSSTVEILAVSQKQTSPDRPKKEKRRLLGIFRFFELLL